MLTLAGKMPARNAMFDITPEQLLVLAAIGVIVVVRLRNLRWPHGPLTAPELADPQKSETRVA